MISSFSCSHFSFLLSIVKPLYRSLSLIQPFSSTMLFYWNHSHNWQLSMCTSNTFHSSCQLYFISMLLKAIQLSLSPSSSPSFSQFFLLNLFQKHQNTYLVLTTRSFLIFDIFRLSVSSNSFFFWSLNKTISLFSLLSFYNDHRFTVKPFLHSLSYNASSSRFLSPLFSSLYIPSWFSWYHYPSFVLLLLPSFLPLPLTFIIFL